MNEECPNCRQRTNVSHSRLIKDSCGHTKCRMCLIREDEGCKICLNGHSVKNIGNYASSPLIEEVQNDLSESDKSNTSNDVLPLELVINRDTKSKAKNFEGISPDYANSYESCCTNEYNKTKEIQHLRSTRDDNISNNLYIPNEESTNIITNVYPHLNSDILIKSSACSETSITPKTEFAQNEKVMKSKPMKSLNRNHIITIPGNPEKYKCIICLKTFRNKKGKCYHDACITGVKPYQCTFCDKSFIKRSHFEYHERIHKGYRPYKCSLCEKAFPQRNKLNRHMYSHGEKQFMCPKCDKRYTKQDDLKNHLNIHNSTTTYSCKTCDKTFRVLTNLKRHLKTHANERPYLCDQCNKSFKHKSLLIRHKKTHGKDRPFSCAHCTRVFLSKSELKRHLTVHTDEKPFSCSYCETVFRRKDNLHRHIRHHHSDSSSLSTNKQTTLSEANTKLVKPINTNLRQKLKAKKVQKVISNSLPKTPTKVSVVYISSCDQISSRLDSMGNITPVIRTTNEVSNAVSVINGPICIKNSNDKSDTKRKTFTYTEPIPLAEAVVINRRIEEKLYPQTASNHNYFLRNCLSFTDKSYSRTTNQLTNTNLKYSAQKTSTTNNSYCESNSSVETSFTYNIEEQVYNKRDKLNANDNINHVTNNVKETCT